MRFLTRTFMKGLVVVLPVFAGVYVMLWLIRDSETALKALLVRVLPEGVYVPGLGLALVMVGVFCIGLLMYPWLTRKIFDGVDAVLRKVPLFGVVYSPVRDLMDLVGGDMKDQLGEVVMIRVPNTDMETLGFVTRKNVAGLPKGFAPPSDDGDDGDSDGSAEEHVVVFVQWSSQVGGYCFVVPRSSVRKVDMTVEEGMRWAITAGVSAPTAGESKKSSSSETDASPSLGT